MEASAPAQPGYAPRNPSAQRKVLTNGTAAGTLNSMSIHSVKISSETHALVTTAALRDRRTKSAVVAEAMDLYEEWGWFREQLQQRMARAMRAEGVPE